jgi:HEAT repeat protein
MSRSIRVAPECLPKVRQALRLHGFPSQHALAIEIGLSRATITSFFTGKRVDYLNFVEISEKLGLDWHAIIYIEKDPPIQVEAAPPSDTPPEAEPEKKNLGIDWRQICRDMLEAQNLGRLTTNPLTAGDGAAFELDEIYVPLGLVERKKRDRRSGDVSPEQGSQLYVGTDPVSAQDEIIKTFHQDEFFEQVLRLGRSRRIAIIGEPGAGKSTLLQKIAAWVLDNTEDVPIWISLADLQGKSLKAYLLEDWLENATRRVHVSEEMQKTLGELFNSGRVWLLLDAVDEMAVGVTTGGLPLQLIANQITGWVADARVVLTCRLNAWDAGKNALEAFDTYRNLHFSPEQISEFVCRWFKRYPEQGEQLRTTLAQPQRERIRDVIKNPLSLALLCRTWQFGEGELPDTRAGLYEQFVEEIYKWKQERFPTNSQQREELNQALGQLALQAIDSKASRFRLRHSFVCKVLGNPESPQFQLALRLGWLNQVGVAAEKNHEAVYAFFHPTFQEYFATPAIDDWHFFLDHKPHNPAEGTYRIFEPQWKEVIKLWLGREDVERDQKEAFIKALVEFEDNCKGFYRYQAYFLAAAGITEFRDCSLSDEIVEQVLKWAFGYFDKCSHYAYLRSLVEGASVALRESDRNRVIDLLFKVISTYQYRRESDWILRLTNVKASFILKELSHTGKDEIIKSLQELYGERQEETIKALRKLLGESQDERICLEIARLLGRIHPGDSEAVAVLTKLKHTTQLQAIRYLAADSLQQTGAGNPEVINALMEMLHSSSDERTRRQAVKSLGEIGAGNSEVINALMEMLHSSPDEWTRSQAVKSLGEIGAGNPDVINALMEMLHSSPDEWTRRQAVESLGEIGAGNSEVINALMELLHSSRDTYTWEKAVESLGKIGAGNSDVINALMEMLHSSPDEWTRRQAVKSLGEIGAGNPEVINALMEMLHSSSDESTRWQAVESLGEIGAGNSDVINALMEVLHSSRDTYTWEKAVESLEKIGAGNPEVINALIEVLHSSPDQDTWRLAVESLGEIDAGNPEVINVLMEVLHSSSDQDILCEAAQSLTRNGVVNLEVVTTWIKLLHTDYDYMGEVLEQAYWNLWLILRASPSSELVSDSELVVALKDCLTDQVRANNIYEELDEDLTRDSNYGLRYIYCYDILWHCAQNMTYPAFYQAWHNQPTPTQSLNLAELPHSLAAAVANDLTLSQTIHLICLNGSKFIDRNNPATKIYTEMVKSGCPKCEDGTPKTMQELQAYWDLLDTDKRVVLVFYEGTGFSETFLDALSKFDGAICVITTQPLDNIPLQWFSPNQAIADVVDWLKKVALEA